MSTKTYIDFENWNRKQLFNHFLSLPDPTFSLVANVDVTTAYNQAKRQDISFFVIYLHACMITLNSVENFKYRIESENKIASYDVIDASSTIPKPDNTFGFSYIPFSENFEEFHQNYLNEKHRIETTSDLFPPIRSENCIYCSAIPWVSFTAHKEPFSMDNTESIPKLSFGKFTKSDGKLLMPVAINVNHALIDGYHIGQFFEKFQNELNKNN